MTKCLQKNSGGANLKQNTFRLYRVKGKNAHDVLRNKPNDSVVVVWYLKKGLTQNFSNLLKNQKRIRRFEEVFSILVE